MFCALGNPLIAYKSFSPMVIVYNFPTGKSSEFDNFYLMHNFEAAFCAICAIFCDFFRKFSNYKFQTFFA